MKKRSGGALGRRLALLKGRAHETATVVGPNPRREDGTKRLITLAIVGCALCGPMGLAVASSGSASSAGAVAASEASVDPVQVAQDQARASHVAQDFLLQYLTASQVTASRISQQLISPPQQLMLPEKAPAAPTRIVLADVAHPSAQVWLISYAVSGGGSGAGETFQVPVQVVGSQVGVITLPSRVGSLTAVQHRAAAANIALPVTGPEAQASAGFLRSWLTNAADIQRWTTSDFTPAPVVGQMCQQITIVSAATDQQGSSALSSLENPPEASPVATPSSSPAAVPSVTGATTVPETQPSATVVVTATCKTATATRVMTYALDLTVVADQMVVSAVNPYQQ